MDIKEKKKIQLTTVRDVCLIFGIGILVASFTSFLWVGIGMLILGGFGYLLRIINQKK